MRGTLLPLLLLAGCFNPKLGSPGYYCHPEDKPACPDGQECISGRCQNRGIHLTGNDGGINLHPDMAGQLPRDMAGMMMTGMTGCKGYLACLIACGSDTTCPTGCDNNVTADGMMKFQAAVACGQQQCLDAGECQIDTTMTMLIDATGRPAGSCNNCLNDSLAGLFGATCMNPASPNCNPAMCDASNSACLSSTP
jgi:hypothetical protein